MTRAATWAAGAALLAASGIASGDADDALAKEEREGPPAQTPTQRFVPDRAAAPPPKEPSAAPGKQEWPTAAEATDVRVTDPSCTVKRIREWYRVVCRGGYLSQLQGATKEVSVVAVEAEYTTQLTFPAREGDARVWLSLRRAKWSIAADVVISEQWLAGDPGPLISVTGIAD